MQGAPQRVGRYEVLKHLATGGMAEIYLARMGGAGAFERHVVLKTILAERASDHRFVTMFLDEAKLSATLNHQNIAQVYDVDQADGAYFMAMEFVHGENVRAILESTLRKNWAIPIELAVHIVSGAAAGLHHAHERRGRSGQPLNIVHRDVSPANIMVGFDGSVKVLDFGIAKAEERSTKTVGNAIKGKYGYMSPEQCKGAPLDRRSDIFALGIVLFELTTLRRAFKGQDDFDTMKKIVSGDITKPSRLIPDYPVELEAIILKALSSKADQRFQSAHEMLEALDAFVQRAKLSVGASAMSRFMVQLFGERREPWVEFGPSPVEEKPVGHDDKTHVLGDEASQSAAMTTGWRHETEEDADASNWENYDSTTAQRHDARAHPAGKASSPASSAALPFAIIGKAADAPSAPSQPPNRLSAPAPMTPAPMPAVAVGNQSAPRMPTPQPISPAIRQSNPYLPAPPAIAPHGSTGPQPVIQSTPAPAPTIRGYSLPPANNPIQNQPGQPGQLGQPGTSMPPMSAPGHLSQPPYVANPSYASIPALPHRPTPAPFPAQLPANLKVTSRRGELIIAIALVIIALAATGYVIYTLVD